MICADERLVPISGPKSIVSFHAGLRASGKSSTATTRPTRMSTFRKSSKSIIGAARYGRELGGYGRRRRGLGVGAASGRRRLGLGRRRRRRRAGAASGSARLRRPGRRRRRQDGGPTGAPAVGRRGDHAAAVLGRAGGLGRELGRRAVVLLGAGVAVGVAVAVAVGLAARGGLVRLVAGLVVRLVGVAGRARLHRRGRRGGAAAAAAGGDGAAAAITAALVARLRARRA